VTFDIPAFDSKVVVFWLLDFPSEILKVMMKLKPTKLFYVFDSIDNHTQCRSIQNYKVNNQHKFSKIMENRVKKSLTKFGCCVIEEILPDSTIKKVRKELNLFSRQLISKYDRNEDEFESVDTDEMNITRMPRIGKGKHNIHFCPEMSNHHQLLVALASEAHFSDILSFYMSKKCTLRETGISLTRPAQAVSGVDVDDHDCDLMCEEGVVAGEGMEWHSDGAEGEATVLMAVEDVNEEVGSVRVVPGSHLLYVPGVGHEEV
jgi:ectoine hydroxylase-related dioxygenase (phytanoyl-CoA dioxygenase family)